MNKKITNKIQKGGFELPNKIINKIKSNYLVRLASIYHKQYYDLVRKDLKKIINEKSNKVNKNNKFIEEYLEAKYLEPKYILNTEDSNLSYIYENELKDILDKNLSYISNTILINDLKINSIDEYLDLLYKLYIFVTKKLKYNKTVSENVSENVSKNVSKNISIIYDKYLTSIINPNSHDQIYIQYILLNYFEYLKLNLLSKIDEYCSKGQNIVIKEEYKRSELFEEILIISSKNNLNKNLINLENIFALYYYIDSPLFNLYKSRIGYLYFNNDFNQTILEKTLPKDLIKLKFGSKFNNKDVPLSGALTNLDKLQELEFGDNFNQDISKKISIKLRFRFRFTNKDILAKSILPYNLIKLKFGNSFTNNNIPLKDSLFNLTQLEELDFGDKFNHKILNKTLPRSLIKLKFGKSFGNLHTPLEDSLFNLIKLEELDLGDDFDQEIIKGNLPNSLIKLKFGFSFNNHRSTPEFTFGYNYKRRESDEYLSDLSNLTKLEELYFGELFDKNFLKDYLPKNLIKIEFGRFFYRNETQLDLNIFLNLKKLKKIIFNSNKNMYYRFKELDYKQSSISIGKNRIIEIIYTTNDKGVKIVQEKFNFFTD